MSSFCSDKHGQRSMKRKMLNGLIPPSHVPRRKSFSNTPTYAICLCKIVGTRSGLRFSRIQHPIHTTSISVPLSTATYGGVRTQSSSSRKKHLSLYSPSIGRGWNPSLLILRVCDVSASYKYGGTSKVGHSLFEVRTVQFKTICLKLLLST